MTIREQEADGLAELAGSNLRQKGFGETQTVKPLPLAVRMVLATGGGSTTALHTDAALPPDTCRGGN